MLPSVLLLVPLDKQAYTALVPMGLAPALAGVMVMTAWMVIGTVMPGIAVRRLATSLG
jgi:hypothetical protein